MQSTTDEAECLRVVGLVAAAAELLAVEEAAACSTQARDLAAASTIYRDLDMPSWTEQAMAEAGRLGEPRSPAV